MGLIRFLLLIVIVWLAIRYLKRWLNPPINSRQPRDPPQVESFVACHKCGLHIPRQEAIVSQGHYYCSESHRDADSP